ncbi:MAG: hypothetical protein ACHQHN_18760 [Sphingobacteriales bacterium]
MASVKYLPLLLLALPAKAQLFGQAAKQKQYYEQQIAEYNALHAELKRGYNVVKNGLGGIRDINTAELNAHTAYYNALKTPSTAIKNSTQVKDILNYQSYISSAFSQSYTDLTPDETNYVQAVKTQILTDCNKDLSDLQNLLSVQLQLTDDERLKRVNAIHAAMLNKYQFTRHFMGSLERLMINRRQSANDTQTLKSLYENH